MKKFLARLVIPVIMIGTIVGMSGVVGQVPGTIDMVLIDELIDAPGFNLVFEEFLTLSPQNWFYPKGGELVLKIPRITWGFWKQFFVPEEWRILSSADGLIKLLTAGQGFYVYAQDLWIIELRRSIDWIYGMPPSAPPIPPVAFDPEGTGDQGDPGEVEGDGEVEPHKPRRGMHPDQWVDFQTLADALPVLAVIAAIIVAAMLGLAMRRFA